MIEVTQICRYPLTGGRAEVLETAELLGSGLKDDRKLLLYRPGQTEEDPPKRVSQLEYSTLACVQARTTEGATELYIPNYGNFYVSNTDDQPDIVVDEFTDHVPVIDTGDQFARRFQRYLGSETVRLAQKSAAWMRGEVVAPSKRSNRPLHIVSMASVRALQAKLPTARFGVERFRPNIVIDGDLEPFEENKWLEHSIVINGVACRITKLTQRCPVPGYDQWTGIKKKDVPKGYRMLEKDIKNRPIFGVYAVPELKVDQSAIVQLSEQIEIE